MLISYKNVKITEAEKENVVIETKSLRNLHPLHQQLRQFERKKRKLQQLLNKYFKTWNTNLLNFK